MHERRDAGGSHSSLLTLSKLGLVELDVLAARTATVLHHPVPADLVCVTTLDGGAELVVRAAEGQRSRHLPGLRIPLGSGIGGRVVSEGRTISVVDYSQLEATRDFLEIMVEQERVTAAVGVPLTFANHPIGVLFLGRRGRRAITSVDIRRLHDVSRVVGPSIGASMQLARRVEAAQAQERQRMASEMHDQLIPLLFAIGAAACRARTTLPEDAEEALAHIETIETMTSSASSLARNAIRVLGPLAPEPELTLRLHAAADRFTALTGMPGSVGVVGSPVVLDAAVTDTLAAVTAEALNNTAKHAPGSSAVVTLCYGHQEVSVAVQDDGTGLPEGFVPHSITDPGAGEHFGLASLAHRLRLLGGVFDIATNEDGGVTVKAAIPIERR